MNASRVSNGLMQECPQPRQAAWAPPEWFQEFVPDTEGFIAELIDAFKTSTETSLQQMRTALASADVPKLRTTAHRAKGGARQIGAEAFAEVCQSLEDSSCQTPVPRLVELLNRCQELFDEASTAMTSYSKVEPLLELGRDGMKSPNRLQSAS
jgi:HPt (histidine-containing phosphotransfer) domain-containing protein